MNICIIPARAGSKRIPSKNIKDFVGTPMLLRAIETALNANSVDEVHVSTDSEEIMELAISSGAHVPFLRSAGLADDFTPTKPVIADHINRLDIASSLEFICCLYPCTPFCQPNHIDECYEVLKGFPDRFVFPVSKYSHPVQRALTIQNGKMSFLYPEHELTRTQDLEPAYHDLGQFYWGSSPEWSSEKLMHSNGHGVEFVDDVFIDIDTLSDWKLAEIIYAAQYGQD